MRVARPVLLEPVDGWGFDETVDGVLASAFEAQIDEVGVHLGGGILGWRGKAKDGKYADAKIEMSPRHVEWSEVVVLRVLKATDRDDYFYYGFANTTGLECNWK